MVPCASAAGVSAPVDGSECRGSRLGESRGDDEREDDRCLSIDLETSAPLHLAPGLYIPSRSLHPP